MPETLRSAPGLTPPTKGTSMRSTNSTKILARTSQCIGLTVLIVCLAFAGAPIASAWDKAVYDKCMAEGPKGEAADIAWAMCCVKAGGRAVGDEVTGEIIWCRTTAKHVSQSPGSDPAPAPTLIPPPVDADQGPTAPVGPVPVGPNTGRG